MSFLGLGGSFVLNISLNAPAAADAASESNNKIVLIDHVPRWKAHKNPFHGMKFTGGTGGDQIAPDPGMQQQQRQYAPRQLARQPFRPGSTPPKIYAYESSQDVVGSATVSLPPGKKADHLGIKISFLGRVDLANAMEGSNRPHYDFISLSKELEPPGTMYTSRQYPFHFGNLEKMAETYHGRHVSVRYLIRVSIERKFLPPLTKDCEVVVQSLPSQSTLERYAKLDQPIKMEVGIEDCLHIEFEYEKRFHHLRDVILGKVHFLLVRIKIKHMELAVIRRETVGGGGSNGMDISAAGADAAANSSSSKSPGNVASSANALTETQVLVKYEIMDGAPIKDEVIPVRLYLGGIPADLTPTYDGSTTNGRFNVRYFLNLVLVDMEDRRYFKQQEIVLYRQHLG
eukprot:CAMPEP_0194371794 /NCGR_PEP_ID=MMETSP0174-20130528/20190_1 /TAXON_ID=216777 /ORGANISM="Proboscia alata, Strain PI-D3" /LENGTH=399 /DNA_ID=CAMNT_0039150025 /DNA_START=275 /DNA_END=1474 /DNA_ORIENTATION=+